jgi:hypothetical protein
MQWRFDEDNFKDKHAMHINMDNLDNPENNINIMPLIDVAENPNFYGMYDKDENSLEDGLDSDKTDFKKRSIDNCTFNSFRIDTSLNLTDKILKEQNNNSSKGTNENYYLDIYNSFANINKPISDFLRNPLNELDKIERHLSKSLSELNEFHKQLSSKNEASTLDESEKMITDSKEESIEKMVPDNNENPEISLLDSLNLNKY